MCINGGTTYVSMFIYDLYFGTWKGTLGNTINIGEPWGNVVSIFMQYTCFSILVYLHYVQNMTF